MRGSGYTFTTVVIAANSSYYVPASQSVPRPQTSPLCILHSAIIVPSVNLEVKEIKTA